MHGMAFFVGIFDHLNKHAGEQEEFSYSHFLAHTASTLLRLLRVLQTIHLGSLQERLRSFDLIVQAFKSKPCRPWLSDFQSQPQRQSSCESRVVTTLSCLNPPEPGTSPCYASILLQLSRFPDAFLLLK